MDRITDEDVEAMFRPNPAPVKVPPSLADNPKQAQGDAKPGMHYVPGKTFLAVAEVFKLGAAKYGLKNWRKQPIRASSYYSAMHRHLLDWFEGGVDMDPESHHHHLAHVIASCMIILDAMEHNALIDDRADAEVKTKV